MGWVVGFGLRGPLKSKPDYGDPVEIKSDELPLFWACGVTTQSVAMEAKPGFCITHAPGHMLITDAKNVDFSVV
jgi:uncharacterized protein YcsI (UPF0317 family)